MMQRVRAGSSLYAAMTLSSPVPRAGPDTRASALVTGPQMSSLPGAQRCSSARWHETMLWRTEDH